jgi:hypothetical protein
MFSEVGRTTGLAALLPDTRVRPGESEPVVGRPYARNNNLFLVAFRFILARAYSLATVLHIPCSAGTSSWQSPGEH